MTQVQGYVVNLYAQGLKQKKNWCAVWVKLVCQISTECVIVHI